VLSAERPSAPQHTNFCDPSKEDLTLFSPQLTHAREIGVRLSIEIFQMPVKGISKLPIDLGNYFRVENTFFLT